MQNHKLLWYVRFIYFCLITKILITQEIHLECNPFIRKTLVANIKLALLLLLHFLDCRQFQSAVPNFIANRFWVAVVVDDTVHVLDQFQTSIAFGRGHKFLSVKVFV